MIEWLVEFGDRTKELQEIKSPELLQAIAPIQKHIAEKLGAFAEDAVSLKIVFTVDPDTGLKFSLRGAPAEVNQAIDLIGQESEILTRVIH